MPGVCVSLLQRGQGDTGPTTCTDEQGRFEFSSIAKGDHVLVANHKGQLSSRQPFTQIFYPNVTERERAAMINVAPGQILNDVDIVIPQLEETVTIEGVLRYSDGKPAAGHYVKFNAAQSETKVDGNVTERTESDGRFTLTVLKNLKGELVSESYLIRNYYKDCPKVDELIAKSGKDNTEVYSNKIELTTEQNLYHVELTLPYPRCERK